MNKWKPSFGRYDLTRGIRKRLWSAYYDFVGSTGEEGSRGDSLEGGVSPNEPIPITPTPNPTATPTPTPPVFGSSGYQWMTINSVTSSTASGVGQNGITISIVQTGGGMSSIDGMYQYPTFPETYGVPGNGTQIRNTQAGTFTVTFSQPVEDALVAFASVGNPSLSVSVQVSAPFTPIWSTATTYQNPVNATQYSQFTGTEGFNIIRIDGIVSSVSFNYTRSEYYCTVCFGFVDQNNP